MKILLIQPVPPRRYWPLGQFRSHWVPTGLAHIAAELRRAGHDVKVLVREEQLIKCGFDWAAAEAALLQEIKEYHPNIVGLSMLTPTVPEAYWIAAQAKAILGPGTLVIAGGAHPTALPERTLAECGDIDAVVIGEAEQTMVELAQRGLAPDIAGLAYREGEQVIHTGPRTPVHDLDDLAPIDYSMFDMAHYTERNQWMIRWMDVKATNIRTSRGCTNRCLFCAGYLVAGIGVRFHSVENVVSRMAAAADRFGVEAIHFEDDTLGADRDRLLTLCEEIKKKDLHRRIRWDACLRVDQADAELLGRMKAAGCVQIEYGFESGSDDSLRRLGKHSTAELNQRAVCLTREAGLRIFADIMIGLPGETEADLDATVKFLRWARPEVVSAARLSPLPGTHIFNHLDDRTKEGLDWGAYAYLDAPGFSINFTGMDSQRFQKRANDFYKYFIRPWMARQVLRDTLPANLGQRKKLKSRLRAFALRHPVHALRLPK